MNKFCMLVLLAGTFIGILGLARGALIAYSNIWHRHLHEEVDNLTPFDHEKFHAVQSRPRPWYVKVNNWLEARHV